MDILLQQAVNGLSVGSVYVIVALGLTLIFGVLHIPNIAHGESFMVGAFATYVLTTSSGLPFVVALILGGAIGGVLGVAMYYVGFRPLLSRGSTPMFISALALSIIITQVAYITFGSETRSISTPVSGTLSLGPARVTTYQVLLIILLAVAVGLVILLVRHSWFGLSMRAMADNRDAAQLMGVSFDRISVGTFFLGSVLGAVGGGLLGAIIPVQASMGSAPVLKALVIIVIGGIGSMSGAVIGGLSLGLVEAFVSGYVSADYRDIVAFALLVVVLVLRPTGISKTSLEKL